MPQSSVPNDAPLTISFYEKYIRPEFDRIHDQFSQIHQLMHQANDRFDFLMNKYEVFHQELTVMGHQMKRMDGRLDRIEARLDKMDGRQDKIEESLQDLRNRFTKLELLQTNLLAEIQKKKVSRGKVGPSNEEIGRDLKHLHEEIAKINGEIRLLKNRHSL